MATEIRTAALVDDHSVVMDGLKTMLGRIGGYEVILTATKGKKFIEEVALLRHLDVALIDLSMRGMNGFEVLRWFSANKSDVCTVAFSFSDDPAWVRSAFAAGACAYVLKDADDEELRIAIDESIKHGYYHSQLALDSLNEKVTELEDAQVIAVLEMPARELEFLRLACGQKDLTFDQIADLMHVSRHAVDGYFRYFSRRFGLRSRSALTPWAIRHKLITLPEVGLHPIV